MQTDPTVPERLPALCIKQPWLWALLYGGKKPENRTWKTEYRGPVALHASRAWDPAARSFPPMIRAWRALQESPPPGMDAVGPLAKDHPLLPTGVVVAVANLTDICSKVADVPYWQTAVCGCGEWAAVGQHHLLFTEIRVLETPIPVNGRLGLWPLPDDVRQQVVQALKEADR